MYNNYYYYTNGNELISGNYYSKEIAMEIAGMVFTLPNVVRVFTVDAKTGVIIKIFED